MPDFFKGKTVFNHWLPGICYSNITFQLVSEATFNKSTLVEYSGVSHEPKQHRTAPYPPQNISVRIVNLNKNNWEEQSGNFPEESFMRSQDRTEKEKLFHFTEETPEIPSGNNSSGWPDFNSRDYETTSQPYWWDSASAAPESEDEFVSVLPMEYENNSTLSETEKSTSSSFSFFPVQMILTWLPPKPPTAFDGFHIHIEREENFTEYLTVDEEAHEFVAELKEPGKYKLSVTTFSSSGSCETRKSQSAKSLSFYIKRQRFKCGYTQTVSIKLVEKSHSWSILKGPMSSPRVAFTDSIRVTAQQKLGSEGCTNSAYLCQSQGPSGEWIEELTEKPQHVSVHVLSSTTALMSWTSSQENYNSTIVSVVSLTCQKQKESQRLEKQYCTQK
ncbi:hypothetical protein P7K49_018958 [Saguinus oedipus]|uniref:R-PTP-O-like Fn3 domain-containing protein n=1 Tax=Saguinus oedipus TaxID=9490 RepID=A0ABQ9UW81_SAGOE|nr:hypothetical protein P7K49_018958 [Saguinus oedipus]